MASIRAGLEAVGVETHVITGDYDGVSDPTRVWPIPDLQEPAPVGVRLRRRIATMLSHPLGVQQTAGYRIGVAAERLDARIGLDAIEVEESYGVGAVARRHFDKPLVVRLHGPWCVVGPKLGFRRDLGFRLRCRVEYQAIRAATAVSSPSHNALDQVREFYGLSLPNARVIPNPVPCSSDEEAWNEENAEPETIVFVGRFDRVKGADTLLEAFKLVADRRPDARLIFIGPDAGLMRGNRTLSLEQYLEEAIPDSVRKRITFLGAQPKTRIDEERRRASLTVVASRYENFPYAVVEAMSAGCPLVASAAGGIKEIIEDGRNGLLFEPENVADLAERIEMLLADRALAACLGAAARAEAAVRYDPRAIAEQARDFYENIAASATR